jgi:hypothetical protein
MYEIQRMTTRQRQGKGSRQTATYRALISIAEEVVAGAGKALDDSAAMRAKDPLTALKIEALRDEIAHYCDLGTRVIAQARRRVLRWSYRRAPPEAWRLALSGGIAAGAVESGRAISRCPRRAAARPEERSDNVPGGAMVPSIVMPGRSPVMCGGGWHGCPASPAGGDPAAIPELPRAAG